MPACGYRTYLVQPAAGGTPQAGADWTAAHGWRDVPGTSIENAAFAVTADPAAGGTLASVTDRRSGAELLAGPGNELLLQPEYPAHPRWGEGPWLLCPAGAAEGSAARPARVRAQRCPAGQRLVAELELGGLRVTQETLLWDGADRVEFRTHVDGSIGRDRLLRVAFPARVPGGLPVYSGAVSVLGRPFGAADTDVAEHEFTLDNPAHDWFGLGSTARVALHSGGDGRELQAIGVAEVVVPDALGAAPSPGGGRAADRSAVRDLLVALAAQGVTATCAAASGPRYGAIDADSNLPDFRILLGGPQANAMTAAVLATAPQAAAALAAQLGGGRTGRVWVPAARSRAGAFAPGADVRGARDLPVLIAAGPGLAEVAAELVDDLADAQIEVAAVPGGAGSAGADRDEAGRPAAAAADADVAGGPGTALAGRSVALLNRGTPSSLVTPDGVLLIALMRACSSWPCGVWIDGEPRTAPDGTSFAWQHWSHTFEYALAAGPADWRAAGFAQAGLDYHRDLLTVTAGLHGGQRPAAASLISADPAAAVLTAVKPRGNPLHPGPGASRHGVITARLRNLGSGPVTARVRLFTGLAGAAVSSLTEDAAGPALPLRAGTAVAAVPPAGMVTLALDVPPGPAPEPEGPAAGPAAVPEPAQPVFARYWLHGKGPAPAGNLPAAVHLSPAALALGPGERGTLRLTVACGPEPAAGSVRLEVPAGLAADPPGPLAFDLPALGHASWEVTVAAGSGPAGRSFVTAQLTDHLGQRIEDAALVACAGGPPPAWPAGAYLAEQQARAAEVALSVAEPELVLAPGQDGQITVLVRNDAAGPVRGEAQLVSPFGSWELTGPWTTGFAAGPGEQARLRFTVRAPAAARCGQHWWALVKLMYFGRVRYTEPVAVSIAAPRVLKD